MGDYKGVWSFVFFLIVVLLASTVVAQETYQIDISVNAVNIDGYNSRYFIYDFNAQNITEGNQVVGRNNILKFSLYQGFYELSIGIDNPATPGFDYYGKISINADTNKSVELDAVPVGSRKIEVLDMNDAPLDDVPVRIDCVALSGEQRYFRTDDFGIAEANFLPIGECVFRAAAGDFIISQNDTIEKGSAGQITMRFDDYSKSSSNTLWIFLFAIIFVILLFVYYYVYRKSNGKRTKDWKKDKIVHEIDENAIDETVQDKSSEEKSNPNIKEDIMTALNPSERKVVSFILEEQDAYVSKNGSPKGFYLHQAKIVYGTGIAKTTLVRLLQSLEQKKIIGWEKSGKIKKVRLTEWFNSK